MLNASENFNIVSFLTKIARRGKNTIENSIVRHEEVLDEYVHTVFSM